MSQYNATFIIGHVVVKIAKKGSEIILHKLATTFSESTNIGSGYRTINGSLNLKPYSTIFCNITVTREENGAGFVKT